MGCLKRVGDKKWRITYDVPPDRGRSRKQKVETLQNKTKAQAEAILADRKRDIASGHYLMEDVTVEVLFQRFMQSKPSLSPATSERYQGLFRTYIHPAFGLFYVKALKQAQLVKTYADWTREGRNGRMISGRTIRHAHELLRNLLNWALRMEYAARNVAALLTAEDLPKADRPEMHFLNETELRQLLSAAKEPTSRAKKRGMLSAQPWFSPAIVFSSYTAARRGEALAVRWSDINFARQEVTIRRSLSDTKRGLMFKLPKNGATRDVALPSSLVVVLREHQSQQMQERNALGESYKDNDLVFALADGSPVKPSNYGAAFKGLVKRAGLNIRLHGLRHTHISLLGRAGVSLKVASERAGHSTVSFTGDRYSHVFRSDDAEAASAFERLVG